MNSFTLVVRRLKEAHWAGILVPPGQETRDAHQLPLEEIKQQRLFPLVEGESPGQVVAAIWQVLRTLEQKEAS